MQLSRKELLNSANRITFDRIVCALLVLVAIMFEMRLQAFAAYLLGWFTDWADGFVARRRNEVTEFGKLFDPLADKILVWMTAFLVPLPRELWLLVPGGILFSQDISLAAVGAYAGLMKMRVRMPHLGWIAIELGANKWGKRKAVLAGFAVLLLFLRDFGYPIPTTVIAPFIALAVVAATLSILGHSKILPARHEERSTRSAWLD